VSDLRDKLAETLANGMGGWLKEFDPEKEADRVLAVLRNEGTELTNEVIVPVLPGSDGGPAVGYDVEGRWFSLADLSSE
jgi:hypothetical protein